MDLGWTDNEYGDWVDEWSEEFNNSCHQEGRDNVDQFRSMLPEDFSMSADRTAVCDDADISFNIRKCGKNIRLRIDFVDGLVYLSTWFITKAGRSEAESFINIVEGYTNGWELNNVIPRKRYRSDTFAPRTKEITHISEKELHSILYKFA